MEASDQLRKRLNVEVGGLAEDLSSKYEYKNDGRYPVSHRFQFAFEHGGQFTGYQQLHGTNSHVGGFHVVGWGEVVHFRERLEALVPNPNPFLPPKREDRGPGARVDFELSFVFNDMVDPNPDYVMDMLRGMASEFVTLGGAESYRLSIGWRSRCSVWLTPSGGRRISGGYPSL